MNTEEKLKQASRDEMELEVQRQLSKAMDYQDQQTHGEINIRIVRQNGHYSQLVVGPEIRIHPCKHLTNRKKPSQ